MSETRLLRAEIRRCQRRVRLLEALLVLLPRDATASLAARAQLVGLRRSMDATWARLLDAELKA